MPKQSSVKGGGMELVGTIPAPLPQVVCAAILWSPQQDGALMAQSSHLLISTFLVTFLPSLFYFLRSLSLFPGITKYLSLSLLWGKPK